MTATNPTNPSTHHRIPAYCLHKASGQAVVYLARRAVYLGPHGSPASLRRYTRLIAQWQAGGPAPPRGRAAADLTVVELVDAFVAWARRRYVPDEVSAFAVATRRLLRLHAETPVEEFGPLALQSVRSAMVADGLCRNVVNAAVHRIRRIWRWGVRNELIAETLWRALRSVPALVEGEEGVRESEPVGPAAWRQLRAVLRAAPRLIRVMVRLQVLTGMRPGEVVRLRPADIQRSPAGWLYRPRRHKTSRRKRPRIVSFGPRARALLEPLLAATPADGYLFRPAAALADYHARRRRPSGSPPRPAAHDPARREARSRARGVRPRRHADHYTVAAYRTAVRRACEAAYPLPAELARRPGESAAAWWARLDADGRAAVIAWRREHLFHPHQLRHSFATRVGNRHGEEAAQKLLGHARLQTTAIYVQRDLRALRPVVERVG